MELDKQESIYYYSTRFPDPGMIIKNVTEYVFLSHCSPLLCCERKPQDNLSIACY